MEPVNRRTFLETASAVGIFDLAVNNITFAKGNESEVESGPAMGSGDAGALLDNLIPYTQQPAAWSDRHGTAIFWWSGQEKSGIQALGSLVGWNGRTEPIVSPVVAWRLKEDGQTLPLAFVSRNFRPEKIVETSRGSNLELVATLASPTRNGFALDFVLSNKSDRARTIEVAFDYPGKDAPPTWEGPFEPGQIVRMDAAPEGSWTTIYLHQEHGRQVLWVSAFVTGMDNGDYIELACVADLSARILQLGPKETVRFVTAMAFGKRRGTARRRYDEVVARVSEGWTPQRETKRLVEMLKQARPMAAKFRGVKKYERLYAHAVASLNSLYIRGDGGYTDYNHITITNKWGISSAFFWDTAFTCVGAREFNPGLAQEAIACFAENRSPRGAMPGTLVDTHRAGEGQAPIMSWSAHQVFKRSGDKRWLAHVYPSLVSNVEFWFRYHCSERGLCKYFNAGQIADDDARFDRIQKGGANQTLYGLESPDLNAFLVMEMKCLAEMAEALGRPEPAAAWRERGEEHGQLIVETMYFPEDAMFFDVEEGTRRKFSGAKTPSMFIPLWANVPLPREEVQRVIEQHMLNPEEFFGRYPFPSLSYDHPKHDPAGYWRGRVWPHFVYWMVQALWRHGYETQAEETAIRLLDMMMQTPWIHENYPSADIEAGYGLPEYNWSLAAAIMYLCESYKEPLP
jgi:hypothetical protein